MWLLAFHELAAAGDQCTFVEQGMAEVDFTLLPLGSWTAGTRFLERMLRGDVVDWNMRDVPPGEVDQCSRCSGCTTCV